MVVPFFHSRLHENRADTGKIPGSLSTNHKTVNTMKKSRWPLQTSFAALAWLSFAAASGAAAGGVFDARDFGARGDGTTLDSAAIQKAVDACAQANGGTVRLSSGTYLSGPLYLHGNNLALELAAGAVLQGTSGFGDYQTGRGDVAGLINADGLTNVSIIGSGIVDGGGAPWWPAVKEAKRTGGREPRRRPKMINIRHCQDVTVRDVTLRNSPSFHLVPDDCENVLIDHVTITAPGDSPNTDAIDPSQCRHVRILNCLLDVGDDNVAVKAGRAIPGRKFSCDDIVVSNCVCLHGHGISIGSETAGGVSNFVVLHCRFDGTVSGVRIKSTRGKGGEVEQVLCRDLTMNNVQRPIDIACYYPKIPATDEAQPVGLGTPDYHDLRIEHVSGDCPESAGLIVGLPESPVRNLMLSDIHLKTRTGLLVKNAVGVELKNVRIDTRQGESIIAENAKIK